MEEARFAKQDRMFIFEQLQTHSIDSAALCLYKDVSSVTPYDIQIIEGEITYRQRGIYNEHSFVAFLIRDSTFAFYLFENATTKFQKSLKIIQSTSPVKISVWGQAKKSGQATILVVRRVEKILRIIGVETQLILSDGSILEMKTRNEKAVIPITQTFIQLAVSEETKEKLSQFISNTCHCCGKFAKSSRKCLNCKKILCNNGTCDRICMYCRESACYECSQKSSLENEHKFFPDTLVIDTLL